MLHEGELNCKLGDLSELLLGVGKIRAGKIRQQEMNTSREEIIVKQY